MPPAAPARHRRRGAVARCRRWRSSSLPRRSSSSGSVVPSAPRWRTASTTAGVSDGLVLGPLLAAAVAGAALAVAAPARSALGQPDRGRPCGRRRRRRRARCSFPRLPARSSWCRSLVAVCVGLARRASRRRCAGRRARRGDARCRSGRRRRRRRRAREPVAGSTAARWLCRPERWAGSSVGLALGAAPARAARARAGGASRCRARPGSRSACRVASGSGSPPPGSRLPPRAPRRGHAGERSGAAGRRRLPAPIAAAVLLARRADLRLATARRDRLRPRRRCARGRDRRTSSGTVPARHDDGVARLAPVPTRRRRRARRRPLALAQRTCPQRRDRAVVRAREHRLRPRLPVAVVGGVALVASGAGAGILGVVGALVVVGSGVALLAGAVAPLARNGSRRSDDDDCRVRGDRDRRVAPRRARRPATRCARCSRPGRRGRDLRRASSRAAPLPRPRGSERCADDCRDGQRRARSRRRDPAGAAARRGAWSRVAVERERSVRARARRPSARSGRERARRCVLAARRQRRGATCCDSSGSSTASRS